MNKIITQNDRQSIIFTILTAVFLALTAISFLIEKTNQFWKDALVPLLVISCLAIFLLRYFKKGIKVPKQTLSLKKQILLGGIFGILYAGSSTLADQGHTVVAYIFIAFIFAIFIWLIYRDYILDDSHSKDK